MHEYGITRDIIAISCDAAKKAGAARVSRINLVIGDLASVVDDCVRFYFEILAEGTMAGSAELVIARIPAELHCPECGSYVPLKGRNWTCPACGCDRCRVDSRARQFYVESVEVES